MYWLRIGSLLDLSIIAAEDTTHNAAKIFDIPNSTLAGYITGVRNIKESAVMDLALRWEKYFRSTSYPLIESPPNEWLTIFEGISSYFDRSFEVESRLRLISDPEPWRSPFTCCAAQVLAQFEAEHPDTATAFTKEDALQYLKLAILHAMRNDVDNRKMLKLALKYVLWRVKNREYFLLEQFGKNAKSFEVRDHRDIPLLSEKDQARYLVLPADHRFYLKHSDESDYESDRPDTPRLKKAATMDILMLCQKIKVEINHVAYSDLLPSLSYCSCISPFGKEINFAAVEAPH
jgi:hypothetical protein